MSSPSERDRALASMTDFQPGRKRGPSPSAASPPPKRLEQAQQSSPTPAAPTSGLRWLKSIGPGKTLLHAVWGHPQASSKVAAFDLDHTLIRPLNGEVFCDDGKSWEFWRESTPHEDREAPETNEVVLKLHQLYEQGFAIVIFTSQAHENKAWLSGFKDRVANIADQLQTPLRVYCARSFDIYRKPVHGAWLEFERNWNGGLKIDLSQSFYVGDAAGKGTSKNDYDRKFAHNIGVPFHTPDEFFLNKPVDEKWSYKGWRAARLDQAAPLFMPTSTPLIPQQLREFDPVVPDAILLVGAPACGKSTFAAKYFVQRRYIVISRKEAADAASDITRHLSTNAKQPPSFIVDMSLPKQSSRSIIIRAIRQASPTHRIRVFVFEASEQLAKHNNVYSVLFGGGGSEREFTTETLYRDWYFCYEEPKKEKEGFDELKRISFKFDDSGPDGKERFKRWKLFLDCFPREVTRGS
ncbi:hypothetical protein JCM10213_004538 [Rhodosporidiobolus nylandii]